MRLSRFFISLLALFFCVSSFAQEKLKIGISTGDSVEIMKVAQKLAKEKYNLDLQFVAFTDYQLPNEALSAKDLDANIFQTYSFLNESVAKRGYKFAVVGETFIYPMGVYSRKIKNLSDLKKGDTIAVPNDPSNQSRALLLLQAASLITLKHKEGSLFTPRDITANRFNLKIQPMDGASAARAVEDVTAVVLNNDFVANAGFTYQDALYLENPKTAKPYINVIVVRADEKDKKVFQELKKIIQSEEVYHATKKFFPDALPAWKRGH